jgi:hypothetical protein
MKCCKLLVALLLHKWLCTSYVRLFAWSFAGHPVATNCVILSVLLEATYKFSSITATLRMARRAISDRTVSHNIKCKRYNDITLNKSYDLPVLS